jgi:hypothetical protein
MNLSAVYRRTLLLSIAVILGLSILAAVVSLSFGHATAQHAPAQTAPYVGRVAAP